MGSGQADHGYWGRAEEMTMTRPSYKINRSNPGTELAAETAAAMAASSVIFRQSNPRYADILVRHAEELYEFADRYRYKNKRKSIIGRGTKPSNLWWCTILEDRTQGYPKGDPTSENGGRNLSPKVSWLGNLLVLFACCWGATFLPPFSLKKSENKLF